MATLYPSLEDLKVDQAMQAQAKAVPRMPALPVWGKGDSQPPLLYPNLAELENYMGLSLSSQEVQQSLPQTPESASAAVSGPSPGQVVAPVSGNSLGALRAEIKPGVREIHLCKDERGKTGLRLQAIDKGIFVQLVQANTPASLVGLRFGDQILQIDGRDCAGWSTDKAHQVVKKASAEKIVIIVRDRPFQRTITMHKDSTGHVGFVIKKGKIISLVKGSSAARNGLLTNHYVCEVNGQNVIGLKDKEVTEILATAGNVITLTIIPTVIYEHMVKKCENHLGGAGEDGIGALSGPNGTDTEGVPSDPQMTHGHRGVMSSLGRGPSVGLYPRILSLAPCTAPRKALPDLSPHSSRGACSELGTERTTAPALTTSTKTQDTFSDTFPQPSLPASDTVIILKKPPPNPKLKK
ncbi:PREDICTED: syntenin-2 [Bison bison bison]|uniref:Syntenin-2 n=1 Tax=Bison bison bison TaxID=43346 RepID=A0A6P3HDC5_BISBB|nr:PREDICTED: syntenin-2 [Bison bison bison]